MVRVAGPDDHQHVAAGKIESHADRSHTSESHANHAIRLRSVLCILSGRIGFVLVRE